MVINRYFSEAGGHFGLPAIKRSMKFMKKKETRGGSRPGAGRKSEGKVLITATIKKEIADKLAMEQNKSAVIETALVAYYSMAK